MYEIVERVEHHYYRYYPDGVKTVLASGMYAWIGEIDETTVLKYPLAPGEDVVRLEAERKMLELVTPHERIIGYKGCSDAGIYLERAPNGTLADYFCLRYPDDGPPPETSVKQRLAWCRETAEAVAWVHSKNILHCDIQPTNLLLDADFHVKLSDFQGRHMSESGDEVLLDGWSAEPTRFQAPRNDAFDSDVGTDLFALGCTLYCIMLSHAVYPDIIDGDGDWDDRVAARFAARQWPEEQHLLSAVVLKCWEREYASADEVVRDVAAIEADWEEPPHEEAAEAAEAA